MRSRRQPARVDAPLRAVSRRTLLAGASAVALPVPAPLQARASDASIAGASDGGDLFRSWLYIDAKIERLQTRWAKLESWLAREHGWFLLSPTEQRALPWSRELRDIEGCLDVLFERRQALLERLPTDGAESLPELAERLAVVQRLVVLDEHPEANAILKGVRQDLLALNDRGPPPPAQGRAPAA